MTLDQLEVLLRVIVLVFAFLFGITIGSFLNVCILRLPKGESLITNNSHCMTCGTEIKRYDLIPVFSWLILRGKCRACGAKISPRYMLVELLTGILFVGVFMRYDYMFYGAYPVMLCLFICGLIVLCFQDIDNQEMVVGVLIYTAIIALVTQLWFLIYNNTFKLPEIFLPESNMKDGIIGMFSVSLVLLLFGFVITPVFYNLFVDPDRAELREANKNIKTAPAGSSERKKLTDKITTLEKTVKEKPPVFGFGMGDVILMAAGGLMLGVKAVITAGFIAIFTGAIYGVYKKIVSDDDDNAFAFGPFLIVGLIVAAFINGSAVDLYLSILGRG
ncbi:MAG: prepilin peptidase [Oscillospiraceae bacterium]|nr:prepilin peptidase [Oscillospiraceae bacterium]